MVQLSSYIRGRLLKKEVEAGQFTGAGQFNTRFYRLKKFTVAPTTKFPPRIFSSAERHGIVRKKRDAEEAPEGHESKRLVTDEMNRTSWGGGWRGDRLRWPEEEIPMLPEMQEVD